jgi:hypothetical protein
MGTRYCYYDGGWRGRCWEPPGKNGRCDEHRWLKCHCGAPAVRDCDGFVMNFVCGQHLCASCKHDHSPMGE